MLQIERHKNDGGLHGKDADTVKDKLAFRPY